MALDKQIVSIDFTGGLDTKTDAKLVLPGKLTRLENGVFREKSIGKRFGSSALSTSVEQGGTIGTVTGVATRGDSLVAESGGSLYVRTASKWSKVVDGGGNNSPLFATLDRAPVVRNSSTQQDFDQDTLGGAIVYAWAETVGRVGVHVMVVDSTTGAVIVPDTIVNSLSPAGSGSPRVVSNGVDKVFIYYALANKIAYVSWTVGATALAAELQPISDFNSTASGQFDVALCPAGHGAANPTIYIACMSNSPGLRVNWYATDMTLLSASDAPGTDILRGLALQASPDGTLYIIFSGTTGTAWVGAFQNGIRVGGYFFSGTGFAFDRGAIWAASPTSAGCIIEVGGHLYAGTFTATGGWTGDPTASLYNARLLSKLALLANGKPSAAVANQLPSGSSVQPTGFIVNFGAPIATTAIARILPGLCGLPAGNRLAAAFTSGASTSYLFPERGRLAYDSSGGGAIDKTALGFSRITFTPCGLKDVPACQMGPLLYIGGARPLVFDGQRVFDAGFQLIPEGLSASSGGAGSLSAGTYGFQAVYAFTDAQGHLHRSAPSPLKQYTASASDSASLDCLSIGETLLGEYTVMVEWYRTAANGTALYKLGTPPSGEFGVNTKNTSLAGSVHDTISDASVVSGELLYTSGGALDNIGPPAYRAACVHQNRLFLFGLEDPYEIRYSTEYASGEGLRFNEALSMRVPAATGKVICGASMDDKLVIFAERAVYVVVGSGPDALGLNGSYSEPQLIPAASGCSVPQSVVVTPDGTMFRGPQGISLLGHDLSVQFIGSEVEDYNADAITSAVVVADQNQVRFGTDSGVTLVYDYLARQWSTFSIGSVAALIWGGLYTRLLSTGEIRQETVDAFLEAGSSYSMLAETSWLKPAGLQGFQRIWRALVLGDCKSQPTSFAISVGYDYDSAYASADQASFTGSLTAGKPFQIRLHLRKQKCEAIRFLLTETPSGGTDEGISLSNLMLEVGVRRGSYKLPSGSTVRQNG
jgi:hypothetical protein